MELYATPFTNNIKDYEILQNVGVVEDLATGFLARHVPTGRVVTLKLIDLQMSTDYDLLLEMGDIVRNTKLCRHENIVNYFTSFVENERLWTVMEPIRIGNCKQLMVNYFPQGIPNETVLATILSDVVRGLAYLHENHFIHNNVRADNILIHSNGQVRLGGLHQMIQTLSSGTLHRSVYKYVGDPEWMAPEVHSQATTFTKKIDIFSLGITAIELLHGKTPFDGWPSLKILLCKLQYELPNVEDSEKVPPKNFAKFTERCTRKNPRNRPTADSLLEDSFIKQARNAHYVENNLLKKIESISNGDASVPLSPMSTDEDAEPEDDIVIIN